MSQGLLIQWLNNAITFSDVQLSCIPSDSPHGYKNAAVNLCRFCVSTAWREKTIFLSSVSFSEGGNFTHRLFLPQTFLQALFLRFKSHVPFLLYQILSGCASNHVETWITFGFYHTGKRNGNGCWVGNEYLLYES